MWGLGYAVCVPAGGAARIAGLDSKPIIANLARGLCSAYRGPFARYLYAHRERGKLQGAREGKLPAPGLKIESMTAVDPSPVPSAEAAPARLVLASASPARRKLLEDSRIAFTVRVSSVDEDAALAAANERARAEGREGLSPAETASLLASLKARAIAEELAAEGVRDALVLGCDSVFEFKGRAYGKPHTAENARERITAMSGHHGTLHTGHALVDLREFDPEKHAEAPAVTELRSAVVHFDELSPAEVEAYIATGEPLWVAGSFTLDGYGSAFIRGIEGEFHTVVGLSIHALRELLRRRGVAVTDLWLPPED